LRRIFFALRMIANVCGPVAALWRRLQLSELRLFGSGYVGLGKTVVVSGKTVVVSGEGSAALQRGVNVVFQLIEPASAGAAG